MNDRLRKLVERLHEKSLRGEVAWRKSAAGAFEVSFARYTIALDESTNEVTEMTIYNDEGEILEYVTENSLQHGVGLMSTPDYNFKTILKDTYQLARRTALGSDRAIDKLLAELED